MAFKNKVTQRESCVQQGGANVKHRTKFRHLLAGLLPILLGVLVVGGGLVAPQAAFAQDNGPTQTGENCMQKVFGTPVVNSNLLNCTANDIRLSRATSVNPNTCIEGTTFTLEATFETIVTANSRYDAGFFFRIDGGDNARGDGTNATGQCSLSALDPVIPPALDDDGDTCGDLNSGTYNVTFTIPGVLCNDSDGDGFLNLPNCTSWHSNQGTACNINTAFDFYPDTKSKCVCDDTFQVPVIVETASITVVKTAAPISVPEDGGLVTFTVMVTNNASFVDLTIDSITDNIYGDLELPGCDESESDPPSCNSNITENTCDELIDTVLAPGGDASCSFKVMVSGDSGQTVTDVVEVCGTDEAGHGSICDDDDADVTITDVPSVPSLTKTAQSAGCTVDVNYQVVVSNNSVIDTLTVNTLSDDKFGDITAAHAAGDGFGEVVSTTCSLPQPEIAALGNFTCSFVGRINSATCNINHTDTVTGDVTDDDGVNSTPSDTANVTVNTAFP
jgi:hypothetical protein